MRGEEGTEGVGLYSLHKLQSYTQARLRRGGLGAACTASRGQRRSNSVELEDSHSLAGWLGAIHAAEAAVTGRGCSGSLAA